jgi:hypothetical protein
MKRIIFLICSFIISEFGWGQQKFNLVCRDFTFEQVVSTTGKNLRNIFESVISKSNYPFKVLEREKMDKIFETLQEEKNLVKDLSTEWKKKLELANIDYLVVGDLSENIPMDNFSLLINFIKISGDDMTVKLPMFITISRKQISDNEELKIVFDREIQAFLKIYFVNEKDENNFITIPKFYEELKKRDSSVIVLQNSVKALQKENLQKNNEIKRLDRNVQDIKSYSEVAKLSIVGTPMKYVATGGLSVKYSSDLTNLLENVFRSNDSTTEVIISDSALIYADEVIDKYPNFPFSYWAKSVILRQRNDPAWIQFAAKAVIILQITTTLDGHNTEHDILLKQLRKELGIKD